MLRDFLANSKNCAFATQVSIFPQAARSAFNSGKRKNKFHALLEKPSLSLVLITEFIHAFISPSAKTAWVNLLMENWRSNVSLRLMLPELASNQIRSSARLMRI